MARWSSKPLSSVGFSLKELTTPLCPTELATSLVWLGPDTLYLQATEEKHLTLTVCFANANLLALEQSSKMGMRGTLSFSLIGVLGERGKPSSF